jgi:ATP-binding cassette subfamily F protein 3
LEEFLIKQKIPLVIVSHDREFLDRVCNKIVDVEDGYTVSYDGNYSKFLEQKKIRLDLWREKYEKQMRFIKEEEKVIKKFRGDPSQIHVANSKELALEKMKKSEDWVRPPPKDKKFRFRFPSSPRCGQSMVDICNVTHGYGGPSSPPLFERANLRIERGDRIGLVGPNGVGK